MLTIKRFATTRNTLQLCATTVQAMKASAAAAAISTVLRPEEHPLLCAENRERCLTKMRQIPGITQPSGIRSTTSKREETHGSVLIPLCNVRGSNEISLLYTRRSGKLKRYSYQISFPGGLRDETDTDYIDCALRETEEEIGLLRNRIDVWGECTLMCLPRTVAIMPVIGFIRDLELSELQLNMDEVDECFTVPLSRLTMPNVARHTQFKTGYSGPVFVIDNHNHIWGITGYLTHIFLRALLPKNEVKALQNNIKFIRPYKKKTTTTTTQSTLGK